MILSLPLPTVAPPPILLPAMVTVIACTGVSLGLLLARRQHRSSRRQSSAAAEALAPYIVRGEGLSLAMVEAIEEFGQQAVVQVLRSARRQLAGERAASVTDALVGVGELKRLLRSSRAALRETRLAALWGLGECGGDQAREALVRALVHPDAPTRLVAREALALLDDEEASRAALRSFLLEPEEGLEPSLRFLRWMAARRPQLLDDIDELGPRVSERHRRTLERVSLKAPSADRRAPTAGPGAGELLEPEDPSSELRFQEILGGGRRTIGEQDWLDDRGVRLAGVFVHSNLGTELAIGFTLLAAAVLGGALAWLLV